MSGKAYPNHGLEGGKCKCAACKQRKIQQLKEDDEFQSYELKDEAVLDRYVNDYVSGLLKSASKLDPSTQAHLQQVFENAKAANGIADPEIMSAMKKVLETYPIDSVKPENDSDEEFLAQKALEELRVPLRGDYAGQTGIQKEFILTAHQRKIDQLIKERLDIDRALKLEGGGFLDPATNDWIRQANQNKIQALEKIATGMRNLNKSDTGSPEVQVALMRAQMGVENEIVKDKLLAADSDKARITFEDCLFKNQDNIASLLKIRKALEKVEFARREALEKGSFKYAWVPDKNSDAAYHEQIDVPPEKYLLDPYISDYVEQLREEYPRLLADWRIGPDLGAVYEYIAQPSKDTYLEAVKAMKRIMIARPVKDVLPETDDDLELLGILAISWLAKFHKEDMMESDGVPMSEPTHSLEENPEGYCVQCGAVRNIDDRFCSLCGYEY